MLIRKLQDQLGISLVEVIIGMALMLIIIGPIASSLTAGIKSYQYNMAQNQNISSARESLNLIADELRYATEISILSSTSIIIPNKKNTKITYKVGDVSRTIYTVTGTPSTTNTLVIAYDGIVQKKIAVSALQSIAFTRDTKKIIISAQLNNNSYTNSPIMTSLTTVVLQNM